MGAIPNKKPHWHIAGGGTAGVLLALAVSRAWHRYKFKDKYKYKFSTFYEIDCICIDRFECLQASVSINSSKQ